MKSNYDKKYIWCLKNSTGKVVASQKRISPLMQKYAHLDIYNLYRTNVITAAEAYEIITNLEQVRVQFDNISSNPTP